MPLSPARTGPTRNTTTLAATARRARGDRLWIVGTVWNPHRRSGRMPVFRGLRERRIYRVAIRFESIGTDSSSVLVDETLLSVLPCSSLHPVSMACSEPLRT